MSRGRSGLRKDEYASLMKCAMPTAMTMRRVAPRETGVGSDLSRRVTCMSGGYRARCIRATWLTARDWPGRRSWSPVWLGPEIGRPATCGGRTVQRAGSISERT